MKILMVPLVLLVFCMCFSFVSAKEKADIIVAQDGSGQFTKIQDAIDSVQQYDGLVR